MFLKKYAKKNIFSKNIFDKIFFFEKWLQNKFVNIGTSILLCFEHIWTPCNPQNPLKRAKKSYSGTWKSEQEF